LGVGSVISSQSTHRLLSFKPGRLPHNPQRRRAATLRRIASAVSGNAGNPLQPEPPWVAAANGARMGQAGVRGEAPASLPPGGFPPLSTRESGLHAANQCCLDETIPSLSRKCKYTALLLSQELTFPLPGAARPVLPPSAPATAQRAAWDPAPAGRRRRDAAG